MKAIGLRDVKRGMRLRVSVRYFNGVTGTFEGYAVKDWEVIPADCHLRGSLDGPHTADRMWDADRMWIGGKEITAVELLDDEPVTSYTVIDGPKMLAETLAVAQTYVGLSNDPRRKEHSDRLQRLLDECARHRPVGPDGKHNDRHTPTCGCADRTLRRILDDEPAAYEAGSSDTTAELSVTGEAMCTVRLADLQTAVAVLEAINPFQHRESERWLDRLKDEL